MKIIAFTRCHYGGDYLGDVLRSTEGFAEQHVVLYTPVPTFGHNTDLPCPDAGATLKVIAEETARGRLQWIENKPVNSQTVLELYPDADIILELDADEIVQPRLLDHITKSYEGGWLTERCYRLPMLHHWRSFDHVCRDQLRPVRLYLPQNIVNGDPHYYPEGHGYIHHFGYARSVEDIRYKLAISMHSDEFRQGWWDEVFMRFPERLTDLHPVVHDIWTAVSYDKDLLPGTMHDHPYFDMEAIE
jgi:hypothetical protein